MMSFAPIAMVKLAVAYLCCKERILYRNQTNILQTKRRPRYCMRRMYFKKSEILAVFCYRPPNSSSSWLLSFKEFLDSTNDLYGKIIINGDFNFSKISWSENLVISSCETERIFYNALSDHYLSQLIVSPSRNSNVLDFS